MKCSSCYILRTTVSNEKENTLNMWKGEHFLGYIYKDSSGEVIIQFDFPTSITFEEMDIIKWDWMFFFGNKLREQKDN